MAVVVEFLGGVAINGSDLRKAVFDECVFAAEATSTSMAGTDLCGSDLSGLRRLVSLTGARVSQEQIHQLSGVMVRDLNLAVADTDWWSRDRGDVPSGSTPRSGSPRPPPPARPDRTRPAAPRAS
ncbi:pentapeptide repeat-containing protein [Nocardiopsis alborubida]|uniref:pentapeptide repeat-containing protein n=1 Tax=Nocardiopsis alborubida TaxID=146802 RepID=UPI002D7EF291|nr:pentapeptide repeat-containing protein [Nocardiopsis alborubida]